MLTHPELVELERTLRGRNVLSVYVNGDIADAAARTQWRTELRNVLDRIEAGLTGASHAERSEFAAARTAAVEASNSYGAGEATPGWLGFFTADSVHRAGPVPVPVPTIVTWGEGANVAPCVRVLKESRPVYIVVADSTRVRIHRYADRVITLVDTLEREVKADEPYHMSKPSRPGFHSGTRGLPGADAAQRDQRQATDLMLAAAAARIEELATGDEWIVLGGIPVVAANLRGRLSEIVSARADQIAIDVHAADALLAAAAREAASRLRQEQDATRLDEVMGEAAQQGAGASGPDGTDRALFNGQVRELFLTSSFISDQLDKAGAVIRRAFDGGATVEHVSGSAAQRLDAVGGVAARLRYAASRLTAPAGPAATG